MEDSLNTLHKLRSRMHHQHQLAHLTLTTSAGPVAATSGADWQPLEGVPGCYTRVVQGAFVMEARYEPGATAGPISVPEAVYVSVEEGRFLLQRLDTEPGLIAYERGALIYLAPGQPHRWEADGACLNVIAFIPPNYRPAAD